jgi:MFS family permease
MTTPTNLPPVPAVGDPLRVPPAPAVPTKKVSAGFLVLYALANFGLFLTVLMPGLFSLPYKVGLMAPGEKVAVLGLVATIGAVVGVVTGPIAGALSDRTKTRFGRRRPWFIAGVLILAAGSTIVALADSIPVLVLGWMVVSLGGAANSAAISPIIAERVPESQRGTAAAIGGIATQLAGVLGYTLGGMLTSSVLLIFLVPVAALAVLGGLFMFLLPEPVVELAPQSIRDTFRQLLFNPRKHRDFSILWVGKLLMQLALAFLSTYQLYFLLDRLGLTAAEAGARLSLVGGIGILVTMTFAITSGTLSDKFKRRRVFVLGSAILSATGMTLMAFADGFGLFVAAVLFILGAAGMFGSVDVALASDLVPEPEQAGKWMTTYNLAATLSTALAPLLGVALLAIGAADSTNYTALFLGGAVFSLVAGVVTMFIKGVR